MERLGMYDEPEPVDAEWMHPYGPQTRRRARYSHSPLLVTALPESKPPRHKYVSNALADQKLCGYADKLCRVILPVLIGEQESKAQAHLQQIALIARSLNCTLVLPNMSKSRFGACSQNQFDLYYEVKSLEALGVRVVAYGDFLEWCTTRRTAPLAKLVEIMPNEQHLATLEPGAPPQSSSWKRCLLKAAPRLQWTKRGTRLAIYNSKNFISSGRSIMDIIQRSGFASSPNHLETNGLDVPQVYAFNWALRHPVFSETTDHYLTYANDITQSAERLLDAAGPIIAVHWRMESVPPANLVACSRGLIDVFRWILSQDHLKDARLAYLATDYPLEDGASQHSGTFRDIGEQHHAAIATLRQAFQPGGVLELFKLVLYPDLARLVPSIENTLETDPGFLGIMDKIIASKAEIFVRGSSQCARN
ncbi:hypothetical protein FRC09_010164, partial [Ceratobasidium sp. 395]